MTGTGEPRIVEATTEAPGGWDARAVEVPGGHALQSVAWAEYRRTRGVEPVYLALDDGSVALVSLRRSRLLPGVEAVVRRGPAHRGEGPATAVARAVAIAGWARTRGARDLFLDPERDADAAYESAMAAAGFAEAPGLEPSIHVMRLPFGAGADRESLWAGLSKSARQRIRGAETAGTVVRADPEGERLEPFLALLRERADVLGIGLASGTHFLRGWRALLHADHARFLVAEQAGELIGGLFLYRHGGIHATAFSADAADRRRELPGTMHLVRWRAILDALEDGASGIDLGGVDLPGRRGRPEPGDPHRGLYEHKRSFGATWVDRAPARRIVLRPWAERAARARRALIGAGRRVRR